MDIERLVVKLFADAAQYNRTMDAVENRIIGLNRHFGIMGRMIDIPILAATGAVTALGAAMAFAGMETLRLAANFETVSISLEVMTGSAEKGQKLVRDIMKLGVETPFKSPELLDAAKQLSAFGFATEDILPTLRVLGEISAGTGTELRRIILAVGQVRVAGRLMGPEMRQLIDAGVPMFKYLADVMGRSETSIKGLVEEAMVGFPEVAKALNKMTQEGGLYFGLMERRSKTVTGQWSALVETVQLGMMAIGGAAFKSFGVGGGLAEMREWVEGMRNDSSQIENVFNRIRDTFKMIIGLFRTASFWIDKLVKAVQDWNGENSKLLDYVVKLGTQLVAVLATIWLIKTSMALVAGIWLLITSPAALFLGTLVAVLATLNEIFDLSKFGNTLFDSFAKAFDLIKSLGPALKDAIFSEDWDLAGKIIFKGLEIGWKTLIHSIKWEILGLLGTLGLEIDLFVTKSGRVMKASVLGIKDSLDPSVTDAQAKANMDDRLKVINDTIEAARVKGMGLIEAKKIMEMNQVLEPLRQQADQLRFEAHQKRRMREFPLLPQFDEYFKEHEHLEFGSNKFIESLKAELTKRFGPEFDTTKPEVVAFGEEIIRDRGVALLTKFFHTFGEAGGEFLQKERGVSDQVFSQIRSLTHAIDITTGMLMGGGQTKMPLSGISAPMRISSAAAELAKDLRREMAKEQDKGIGMGTGQFDFYKRQVELLNEARFGPLANKELSTGPVGMMLKQWSKSQGDLTDPQYKFGMQRAFLNLQRWVGGGDVNERLPPTAMRGTVEAQDIANRSALQQLSIEEEVRNLMMEANKKQSEQLDAQLRLNQILEGLFGGPFSGPRRGGF